MVEKETRGNTLEFYMQQNYQSKGGKKERLSQTNEKW